MGVKEGEVGLLVDGVLLYVQARRVNVGAQDVHAGLDGVGAHAEEREGLAAGVHVEAVARLDGAALGHCVGEVHVAGGLGKLDGSGHALALGLVLGDELSVVAGERLKVGKLAVVVAVPSAGTFHG